MAVLDILKMGEPLLWQQAEEVREFNTPQLLQLINDMHETMQHYEGVGIAAPQVGVSLQVVIFGSDLNPRYPEAPEVPFTVLINPQLTPLGEEQEEGWEGCLSIPGLRGRVPRYTRLAYQGFDQFGQPLQGEAEGFHARVIQHECDHLQGVLYPQRMTDLKKLGYLSVLFPEQADEE